MVGSATEGPDPPLGSSEGRGVNCESLLVGVPSGGGLKTTDVGAVAKFGLGVAADDLVFGGTLEEDLVLFGATLFTESDLKLAMAG
jgi:hypothetical protein